MELFKEKKKLDKKELFDLILLVVCVPILALGMVVSFSMLQSKRMGNVPSVFGYSFLTVVSESMEPMFYKGDNIVVKHVDASDIVEGDIISFHGRLNGENVVITHKVNSITTTTENGKTVIAFETYGINNDGLDPSLVSESSFIGRYVRKGGSSAFVGFMSSSWGLILFVIIPLGFIIISDIFTLMNIVFDIKNEKFDNAYRYKRQLNLLGKSIDDYVIVRIASSESGATQYMLTPVAPPDGEGSAGRIEK